MTAVATSLEPAAAGWPFPRLWVVKMDDTGDEEVFIAGDFNRWQLPGVPMQRSESGTWEARVPLSSADLRRFACFVLSGCGFRAVTRTRIECSPDQSISY
ncbi:MAG: hypothetical protein K8S99_10170 [Planctomycetes bacterium]|nr:hypothetical protein [Planctomycetota bacterium]